jgi:hypothetical protein
MSSVYEAHERELTALESASFDALCSALQKVLAASPVVPAAPRPSWGEDHVTPALDHVTDSFFLAGGGSGREPPSRPPPDWTALGRTGGGLERESLAEPPPRRCGDSKSEPLEIALGIPLSKEKAPPSGAFFMTDGALYSRSPPNTPSRLSRLWKTL